MMMVSDDFLDQILSLPKSDIDKNISPCCIELETKLKVKGCNRRRMKSSTSLARYLWCVVPIQVKGEPPGSSV